MPNARVWISTYFVFACVSLDILSTLHHYVLIVNQWFAVECNVSMPKGKGDTTVVRSNTICKLLIVSYLFCLHFYLHIISERMSHGTGLDIPQTLIITANAF